MEIKPQEFNWKLNRARKNAHKVFDKFWKSGLMTRGMAYQWLAKAMKIEAKDCHFSMFNEKQCEKVIKIMEKVNFKSLGL